MFRRLEVCGKRPVWSLHTFPVNVTTFAKAQCVRTLGSGVSSSVVITGALAGCCVERTFLRTWRKSPFAVASALGRCFRTRAKIGKRWSVTWFICTLADFFLARPRRAPGGEARVKQKLPGGRVGRAVSLDRLAIAKKTSLMGCEISLTVLKMA